MKMGKYLFIFIIYIEVFGYNFYRIAFVKYFSLKNIPLTSSIAALLLGENTIRFMTLSVSMLLFMDLMLIYAKQITKFKVLEYCRYSCGSCLVFGCFWDPILSWGNIRTYPISIANITLSFVIRIGSA